MAVELSKLQRAMGSGIHSGFVFQVFDLIYLDGYDLTRTPLIERKAALKAICTGGNNIIRYREHIQGKGDEFYEHSCEYGIEGIVSKLSDSPYRSTRNRNWLKVKCYKRQEFVIVGYTPSSKGIAGIGSLILGVNEKGKLVYAGRVGTGFSLKVRTDLQKELDKFARDRSPLAAVPKIPGCGRLDGPSRG